MRSIVLLQEFSLFKFRGAVFVRRGAQPVIPRKLRAKTYSRRVMTNPEIMVPTIESNGFFMGVYLLVCGCMLIIVERFGRRPRVSQSWNDFKFFARRTSRCLGMAGVPPRTPCNHRRPV